MPFLSILIIRTALVYLLSGFTLGGLLLINKAVPFYPQLWQLLPIHIELLLVGWMVQLVIGVAFWMLPRLSTPPVRGNESVVQVSFFCLNWGILCVCLQAFSGKTSLLGVMGRILEFIAILLFAAHAWPRVRPFGE
jgi:hypothetical protein